MAEAYRKGDEAAIENGGVHSAQFETVMADGQIALFEVLKAPLRDEAGRTTGVIGVARDISERRKADEGQRIAAIAFEAQEGILIIGDDQTVLQVNQAYHRHDRLCRPRSRRQDNGRDRRQPGRPSGASAEIVDSVARDGAWRGEYSGRRKSGEVFPRSG